MGVSGPPDDGGLEAALGFTGTRQGARSNEAGHGSRRGDGGGAHGGHDASAAGIPLSGQGGSQQGRLYATSVHGPECGTRFSKNRQRPDASGRPGSQSPGFPNGVGLRPRSWAGITPAADRSLPG